MNIARVEYYFAEMLSILEMPRRDEWVVDLVPSQWKNDPKQFKNGKFTLPPNMWYCGTINNDDSTFAVTDKVYDRAMPINIDNKGVAFEAPDTPPVVINYHHFEDILNKAKADNPVSADLLDKLALLDDYIPGVEELMTKLKKTSLAAREMRCEIAYLKKEVNSSKASTLRQLELEKKVQELDDLQHMVEALQPDHGCHPGGNPCRLYRTQI